MRWLLLLLIACSPSPKELRGVAMTIEYRMLLSNGSVKKAQAIVNQTFSEVNARFNNWNPDSEVSQINQLAADEWLELSAPLYSFLERVGELVERTGGRFDPTVGLLQEGAVGWDKLELSQGRIRKKHPLTQLDLCGVAKGHCVDLLLERLREAGFSNLYVSWGGEIATSGTHPSGRPWRVAIQPTLQRVELHGAIATSGDYEQRWVVEGRTYTHIRNPFTLSNLEVLPGQVASATVLASDCLTADALATAAMLCTVEEVEVMVNEEEVLLFFHS